MDEPRRRSGARTWVAVAASLGSLYAGCASVGTTATGSLGESSKGSSDGSSDGKTDDGWFIAGMVLLGTTVVGLAVTFTAEVDLAENYLDKHRRDVEIALARGAGRFVRDVAGSLALPEALVPAAGAALKRERDALMEALRLPRGDDAAPQGRATVFFARVGGALERDPRIAPHLGASAGG